MLSKGHVTPALYGVLAERGFFPKEELKTFRALNSRLQGHPNMNDTPGVDMSTGSLGQGVSTAQGTRLQDPPIIVPIIRAGLGMVDPALSMIPDAQVGFIGMTDRRLLHAVPRLIAVPGTGAEMDYDTLAELAEWERRRA